MAHHRSKPGPLALALAGFLALGAMAAPPARAADLDKLDSSLKWVPADAGFYSASLRNKEQLDALLKSKAWARIVAMPSVQQLIEKFNDEYKEGGQLAGLKAFYEDKDNKEMMQFFADAFSSEVFCTGSDSWGDLAQLYSEASMAMQFAPIYKLTGKDRGLDESELQQLAVLKVLNLKRDLIKTPDIIIGFKLAKPKRGEEQLARLENTLKVLAFFVPQLKDRVKRTKVGNDEHLTINIDGDLIPWDAIDFKKFEDKAGEFDPLLKKLKALTLTISLGVRDDFLLVGIGPSTDHLAKLGGKGDKLIDRKELKPLAKYADRKLTGLAYVSKSMAQKAESNASQLEAISRAAEALLGQSGLPEKKQKEIRDDLDAYLRDLKKLTPEPGPTLSFSFWTDTGYEGFIYNYGEHKALDGSKPLTILDHLGGSPLLAAAMRGKQDLSAYKTVARHFKTLWGHAEEILNDKLEGDAKDKFKKAVKVLVPLCSKFDEITVKEMFPSLSEPQFAFVLDGRWTSKQWHKAMPETPKALPMPEVGIVIAVSDADLFKKAMNDYRLLLNDFFAGLREVEPNVPEIKIPEPKSKKGKNGDLYYYPIPEESGLDAQFLPTGGLQGKFAALTLSQDHTERLLAQTTLKVRAGPLARNLRENLAAASLFDWAGLVDAFTPWVDYAAPLVIERAGVSPDDDKKKFNEILDQVKTVLTVLKCFKGATTITTIEDGVAVTHTAEVYEDLK
jgi:hypothetical protein